MNRLCRPPLLHQMWESQPFVPIFFHPLLFIPLTLCCLFFPLHFFLEVMGWGLCSGDCHTGQLIWNNEEFKPLLSHLSGFVADRIKNWKGGSERQIVCEREQEREKKSWLMFVCSCTYSVCAHYMLSLKLTDIGYFTYMSFSIQPEKKVYRFLRCAAFSKETLFLMYSKTYRKSILFYSLFGRATFSVCITYSRVQNSETSMKIWHSF